jgi:hypothetical protein
LQQRHLTKVVTVAKLRDLARLAVCIHRLRHEHSAILDNEEIVPFVVLSVVE